MSDTPFLKWPVRTPGIGPIYFERLGQDTTPRLQRTYRGPYPKGLHWRTWIVKVTFSQLTPLQSSGVVECPKDYKSTTLSHGVCPYRFVVPCTTSYLGTHNIFPNWRTRDFHLPTLTGIPPWHTYTKDNLDPKVCCPDSPTRSVHRHYQRSQLRRLTQPSSLHELKTFREGVQETCRDPFADGKNPGKKVTTYPHNSNL